MNLLNSFVKARPRRRFDPSKKDDLSEFAYFLKNNKWKNGCPFVLEWPYADVNSMCLSEFAKFSLT